MRISSTHMRVNIYDLKTDFFVNIKSRFKPHPKIQKDINNNETWNGEKKEKKQQRRDFLYLLKIKNCFLLLW